jgi:hypothetical protein
MANSGERADFCLRRQRSHVRIVSGAPEEIRTPSLPPHSLLVKRARSARQNRDISGSARSSFSITIKSLRRGQSRRFYAATFLLPLPRRFHERNFGPEFGQQKALENGVFSRACCLVAGIGFEPMTFRLSVISSVALPSVDMLALRPRAEPHQFRSRNDLIET